MTIPGNILFGTKNYTDYYGMIKVILLLCTLFIIKCRIRKR